MFENVGEKLKVSAQVLLGLGLSVGIIYLFVSVWDYCIGAEYYTYVKEVNKAYYGIVYSIMLIISSIIFPWFIYGFGIIVSKFENEEKTTKEPVISVDAKKTDASDNN